MELTKCKNKVTLQEAFLYEEMHLDPTQSVKRNDEEERTRDRRFARRIDSSSAIKAQEKQMSIPDGVSNLPRELIVGPRGYIKSADEPRTENTISKNKYLDGSNNNSNYSNKHDKNIQKRKDSLTRFPEMMSRLWKTTRHRSNSSSLRNAVRKCDTGRVIELVADHHTNVDGAGENGVTALHETAIDGNLACMKILLSYGAKINVCDSEGFTPLDYAVFGGNFECAEYLIEKGANDDRIRDGQIMHQDDELEGRSKVMFSQTLSNR